MTTARKPVSVRGRPRSRREEGGDAREQKRAHVSVMTKEVLEALALRPGDVVVDATFGQGGHSRALKASQKIQLIAIDADKGTLMPRPGEAPVVIGNFADLTSILKTLEVTKVDKVLFDLGWNRGQLASGRGFSFLHDEPLNMSYGTKPRSGFTAAEILNEWSEPVLADVIFGYGEERYARRIARMVVERRATQPFATSVELAEVVRDSVPAAYRRGRIHPATKTFQALRIAVNDELGALDAGLRAAWHALTSGGRIAVITFHSIEDRAVKRHFAALAKTGEGKLMYKKPLAPTAAEIRDNPASRSAKLRAIEKL
ncbi:16S rRNA (cytosine(1402)-N(4))-methyltransferase RsmH [Candidatus Kaiserbacteria bacterium]|nr:16S rRNA (cytosine(1402)-N(4))-methyltransferase RsmH [Candidatus Kaiserbacteria bacterium]